MKYKRRVPRRINTGSWGCPKEYQSGWEIDEDKVPYRSSKKYKKKVMKICDHCKMDIEIRNPSGYCDHHYYPYCCNVCNEPGRLKEIQDAKELIEANGYKVEKIK